MRSQLNKAPTGLKLLGVGFSLHLLTTAFGPSVWTGRALQVESDDLEKLVLRFCIRPVDGAFELLAIMDIRARSISFTTRPRRPYGPPDHERAGETFSPSPLSDSQTSAGNPLLLLGLA
jgi:hypothetical protein